MWRLASVILGLCAFATAQAQTPEETTGQPTADVMLERLRPSGGTLVESSEGLRVIGADPVDPLEQTIDLPVLFAFDSAELTVDGTAILDDLGTALTDPWLQPYRFLLAGHTDAVGNATYNLDLSRRRALAVMQYLVSRYGIEAERLVPIGYGESRLLVPVQTRSWQNRRVEITNLGQVALPPGQ